MFHVYLERGCYGGCYGFMAIDYTDQLFMFFSIDQVGASFEVIRVVLWCVLR